MRTLRLVRNGNKKRPLLCRNLSCDPTRITRKLVKSLRLVRTWVLILENISKVDRNKKRPLLCRNLSCDPARIRTWDPQLRRLLLYPTELRDHYLLALQKYKNILYFNNKLNILFNKLIYYIKQRYSMSKYSSLHIVMTYNSSKRQKFIV